MRVQFKIKPKGGVEETITAELVDVIAWEEHFQKPSTSLSGGDLFARDFVWLAWHAAHRQARTTLGFMEWVATLDDIEGEEDAPLAPSESTPPTG